MNFVKMTDFIKFLDFFIEFYRNLKTLYNDEFYRKRYLYLLIVSYEKYQTHCPS